MYDVLVKNGKIVTADAVFDGNIAVKNGKIAALMSAGEEPEAAKVIDAKGNYVFPGAIDTHAHRSLRGMSGEKITNMEQRLPLWADIRP